MIDLGVGHLLAKNPIPIPPTSKSPERDRCYVARESNFSASESQVYMVFDVKLMTSPCFLTVSTRS
ncbi:unnamed protein product, partial [Musa hybrid cultivar]